MLLKLLENGQWEEHTFLSDFPSLKAVWSLLKMLNTWDIHRWAKQWVEWRNLSLKTWKSLSMNLLMCWWFNFHQFRALWKTIWLCIGLSPNLCSQCWV